MRGLLAQLRVELILATRRGENLLVTMLVPVVLLVFFAGAAPIPIQEGGLDFLVPGILALAVVSTSMVSLGIATAFERYYGVLKRLVGSPLPRGSLLASKAISVLLVEVVQAVILVGIATLVFGWQPRGNLALGVGVLLLGSITFAGLGLLMAGTLRAEATLALANALYLAFLLIGGFVFPVDRLPGAVSAISTALPAAALADATRAAFAGQLAALVGPLSVLVGWGIVLAGAAAFTFRAE